MLRHLADSLRRRRSASLDRNKARYIATRRPQAYAPHDVALYAGLLRQVREARGIEIGAFTERTENSGPPRLYLRHDVDTAACVAMLPKVLDVNLAEEVVSPVYIRTDGVDYAPERLAAAVSKYRARGIEFGLHSSCYTQDDYMGALRRETERFEECFGFRPRSFTVHGLGTFRSDVRDRFAAEIIERLDEFGFTFTDCNARMRSYDYVITDCHPEPESGRRFIYADMLQLPRFFQRGRDYLVLTHPCYWR